MNDYTISTDIRLVRELLNMSYEEFAAELGVSRMSLYHWETDSHTINPSHLSLFYQYVFKRGIRLNKIKEQFYYEDCASPSHTILFHGAKTQLDGEIALSKSRKNNDFGQGFYCGESLEQSAMFVANYPTSSLYILDFNTAELQSKTYHVDRDWMLTIAFFRGKLNPYNQSSIISDLLGQTQNVDYYIAPIADNRMFEIIDSFIEGEITDVQCCHCLSATSLGNQYVLVSPKAVKHLTILEHCYLSDVEKEYYLTSRQETAQWSHDKVKVAIRQYRGQGQYIDEIFH